MQYALGLHRGLAGDALPGRRATAEPCAGEPLRRRRRGHRQRGRHLPRSGASCSMGCVIVICSLPSEPSVEPPEFGHGLGTDDRCGGSRATPTSTATASTRKRSSTSTSTQELSGNRVRRAVMRVPHAEGLSSGAPCRSRRPASATSRAPRARSTRGPAGRRDGLGPVRAGDGPELGVAHVRGRPRLPAGPLRGGGELLRRRPRARRAGGRRAGPAGGPEPGAAGLRVPGRRAASPRRYPLLGRALPHPRRARSGRTTRRWPRLSPRSAALATAQGRYAQAEPLLRLGARHRRAGARPGAPRGRPDPAGPGLARAPPGALPRRRGAEPPARSRSARRCSGPSTWTWPRASPGSPPSTRRRAATSRRSTARPARPHHP